MFAACFGLWVIPPPASVTALSVSPPGSDGSLRFGEFLCDSPTAAGVTASGVVLCDLPNDMTVGLYY